MEAVDATAQTEIKRAGRGKIVLASLVGTTIEFYDFYIFGTAAALVFGSLFFPKSAPQTQTLNAYLTFGIAFLARPVGSFLFGHFGDRIGRKSRRRAAWPGSGYYIAAAAAISFLAVFSMRDGGRKPARACHRRGDLLDDAPSVRAPMGAAPCAVMAEVVDALA